jgi:hypothetical protein
MRRDTGFTLAELLLATTVTIVIVGGIFALASPSQGVFAAQPEVADMQQRLRIAIDELQKDLLMSGNGGYAGSSRGSLTGHFAPLLPYRIGDLSPDAPGSYHRDRMTVMFVPETAAQTRIASAIGTTPSVVDIVAGPGCPAGDPSCGFARGMAAVVMDELGAWDPFTVSDVQGPTLTLQHRGFALNKVYPAGSPILQFVMHTYWLKLDQANETFQLMRYDGRQTDAPIAENVVALTFEYYGDPNPPVITSTITRDTTYGPKPPALDVDNPDDSWAVGENCVFVSDGTTQTPRLNWLGSPGGGLVALSPSQLSDGPWCPDASAAGRYDADLLRVRMVRASLRVQAASPSLRGRAGPLFAFSGTSLGGERFVPDLEISLDVTPRNLGVGR